MNEISTRKSSREKTKTCSGSSQQLLYRYLGMGVRSRRVTPAAELKIGVIISNRNLICSFGTVTKSPSTWYFPSSPLAWKYDLSRRLKMTTDLNGQCHEIFDLCFFSSNYPTWVIDSRVKPFCIWLRNCKVIQQSRCTSGVIGTAGAALGVSMKQLVPPQCCHWHCKI
jgi:hypothetical protein